MNSSLQLGNNITRALAGVYTCQVQNAESLLVKIAKITLNVRCEYQICFHVNMCSGFQKVSIYCMQLPSILWSIFGTIW